MCVAGGVPQALQQVPCTRIPLSGNVHTCPCVVVARYLHAPARRSFFHNRKQQTASHDANGRTFLC